MDDLLASDAVGVNRIGTITIAGRFYARRGRTETARRLLQEGRDLVDPLLEAQFTGPIYVGLVELSLIDGQPEIAAADAATGVEQLGRTQDRYYVGALLAIAARAEADVAEAARARRDRESRGTRGRRRGRLRGPDRGIRPGGPRAGRLRRAPRRLHGGCRRRGEAGRRHDRPGRLGGGGTHRSRPSATPGRSRTRSTGTPRRCSRPPGGRRAAEAVLQEALAAAAGCPRPRSSAGSRRWAGALACR